MSTPQSSIYPLSPTDVDDVWTFFQRIPESDRTFTKEPVTGLASIEAWLTDDRGRRRFVSRSTDGPVNGYLAVLPGVGWSRHVAEVRIVVDPAARRQGIGGRLARHAVLSALADGLTKIVVEVVAHQESTLALFTGLGFRPEALLADHVQDPEGNFSDLIVLANRTDLDWEVVNTVGLDEILD